MALYDQHLHTRYSMDSEADPEANVRRAVELGLSGLTFTDHFDTHPSEWDGCEYDYEALADVISRLRDQYGDRVFIGHGIEICYQPDQLDRILAYLDSHAFDLVLLSVHWFDGRALHIRDHWDGLDASSGTRGYLEAVLQAAQLMQSFGRQGKRPFDILGHIDLVKRYTQRYFETYDIESHCDLIDEILKTCIGADVVPELNLSTLRQSLPEPTPAEWVVGRYAELGGKAMAIGSDAHTPDCVGAGLTDGAAILKNQGVTHQAVFKGRRRTDELL